MDPRLDPVWLNAVLPQAGTDIDRRLAAALRRHRTALEEVCDLAVTHEYGGDNARTALHVRGRLIALGVLGPPAPARLRDMLGRRGHPCHVGAALQLVETVVEHSPNGSLNTPEWQQLEEEDLHHFAAADYVEGRTGQGERELVQAAARRCMTGLLCRHYPLTTQAQVGRARNGALRHLATATQVGDVTVLGRLLERLADAAPQEAVTVVNAAARKLRTLSTGKVTTLAQRWQRPLWRLAERAGPEQWRELVEGVWDGPVELLRVLIRSGIRHRTDDTARYLLTIANSSPWSGVVRETVRSAPSCAARAVRSAGCRPWKLRRTRRSDGHRPGALAQGPSPRPGPFPDQPPTEAHPDAHIRRSKGPQSCTTSRRRTFFVLTALRSSGLLGPSSGWSEGTVAFQSTQHDKHAQQPVQHLAPPHGPQVT